MKGKREVFVIQRDRMFLKMVTDLMEKRGFNTYTELFRALVRESWEKWCRG